MNLGPTINLLRALLGQGPTYYFLTYALSAYAQPTFHSTISPIPPKMRAQMAHTTWHKGCPLPINQLAYIKLSFWGFDGKIHQGSLIANKTLAPEIVSIFKQLFYHKFNIYSMIPMEYFAGSDQKSMAANNTSAFNCREVTSRPGEFSQHSYGRAIDINPLINPYVNGNEILPKNARFDKKSLPGKIIKNNEVYRIFVHKGWDWGGNWYDLQDYQHVEKRANGEKRNPYGYGVTR